MNLAFEISEADVNTVMNRHNVYPLDDDMVDLFDMLDTDAITEAALNGGTDMDDQTNAALSEIENQLIAAGKLSSPKVF
jgi:enamine deaminase RidA (YjgF/YER057c/UK114 family)